MTYIALLDKVDMPPGSDFTFRESIGCLVGVAEGGKNQGTLGMAASCACYETVLRWNFHSALDFEMLAVWPKNTSEIKGNTILGTCR